MMSEPSRALELCQAVAAQLEQQAHTHLTLPPVCAAITHGFLRQVDALGFSSNFEGWPAIVAARVVAKLQPGECAIEQSVWAFDSLLRDCAAVQAVPGKPHDTKLCQVRIHQRIQFPTAPRPQALQPAPPWPGSGCFYLWWCRPAPSARNCSGSLMRLGAWGRRTPWRMCRKRISGSACSRSIL